MQYRAATKNMRSDQMLFLIKSISNRMHLRKKSIDWLIIHCLLSNHNHSLSFQSPNQSLTLLEVKFY